MSSEFLSSLQENSDPVLSSGTQFELACIGLHNSPLHFRAITWDRDPVRVIAALDESSKLPPPEPQVPSIMELGTPRPVGVTCSLRFVGEVPRELADTKSARLRTSPPESKIRLTHR